MATKGDVENSFKQNGCTSEVIILSSDEEETDESSDDLKYSFDHFILACRRHIAKEVLTAAREAFNNLPKDPICSKEIAETLKHCTKLVNKDNASRLVDELFEKLKNGKVVKQPTVLDTNSHHARSTCYGSDVTNARDFKEIKNTMTESNTPAVPSDDEVDFVCEIQNVRVQPSEVPSTSSGHRNDELKFPKTGKMDTKDLTSRQKKRLGMKLKRRLKEISQEIKILNKSELTLDEMEMADSNYIKENRLKKKFDKTWNKLCKILGRPSNTGRVVEKPVKPSGTGYSIIDKAIEKFMKEKQGKFPDYFDIRDVVMKTNEKHDLRMAPQVLKGIIADVFTDIGNKLQRLREKDLMFNFGSHLLDDFKAEEDPANESVELSNKLERNRKTGKKNLKRVYAKYTHLERYERNGKKPKEASTTDSHHKQHNDSESGSTTTDDEKETSQTATGILSISEEENSINPTSPLPLMNGNEPTTSKSVNNDLESDTKPTVEYVSLLIDGDSIDCVEAKMESSTLSGNDTSQTPGNTSTQVENSLETSLKNSKDDLADLNDDCCIIDEPEDAPSPSIIQTSSRPTTPEQPCHSGMVSHNLNPLKRTELSLKKRKAEERVEELVLALKRRKLKAPGAQVEVTSTVVKPEKHLMEAPFASQGSPSLGTGIGCVRKDHPFPVTGEQPPSQEQKNTSNGVSRLLTDKLQSNMSVNQNNESKPDITLSSRKSNATKNGYVNCVEMKTTGMNKSSTVVSSNSGEEKKRTIVHDVIIIDD